MPLDQLLNLTGQRYIRPSLLLEYAYTAVKKLRVQQDIMITYYCYYDPINSLYLNKLFDQLYYFKSSKKPH